MHRFLRFALPWALAALAVSASTAHARGCDYYGISPAPVWQWQQQQPPNAYFLHSDFNGPWLQRFNQAGLGLLRFSISKNQGDPDYSNSWPVYDSVVAAAQANGTELMAMLNPDWDMSNPNDGQPLPNAFINQMVAKFIAIANRYGNTIKYYEILNEPNCCPYVDPAVFAKLMAEIYVNAGWIIQHDNLHLISGALYGGTENPFQSYASQVYGQTGLWDWMLANRGRRYPWDGFGFHPYVDRSGTLTTGDMDADIGAIQSTKVANGDYVSLWLTEWGWSTQPNNIDGVWVSEATQAANIDTALNYFQTRGDIARVFLFRMDDWQGYGLMRTDDSPKPSLTVMANHTTGCVPLCPRAGEACGTGCCPGLTCDVGTCSTCAVADAGCAASADCCTGLVCNAGACGPPLPPDAGPAASDAGEADGGGLDGGGLDGGRSDGGSHGGDGGGSTPERAARGCGCGGSAGAPFTALGLLLAAWSRRRLAK